MSVIYRLPLYLPIHADKITATKDRMHDKYRP